MEIRWANIFGLMLLVFCIYMFIKMKPFLERFLEEANYGYCPGGSFLKVAILGLLCLTIVAVVKILSQR